MDRFWSKTVTGENGCILWGGQLTSRKDYGKFWFRGKADRAHIVSFILANGYRPVIVRHTCDVSLCVNPSHLVAGTVADNNQDMMDRSRYNLSGLKLGPKARSEKAKSKTHCKVGHELSGDNLVNRSNNRVECKACKRNYYRENK